MNEEEAKKKLWCVWKKIHGGRRVAGVVIGQSRAEEATPSRQRGWRIGCVCVYNMNRSR